MLLHQRDLIVTHRFFERDDFYKMTKRSLSGRAKFGRGGFTGSIPVGNYFGEISRSACVMVSTTTATKCQTSRFFSERLP